jgi:hypothetical protein
MYDDLKTKLEIENFIFKSLKKGIEIQSLLTELNALDQALTKLEQGSIAKAFLGENPDSLDTLDSTGVLTNISKQVVELKAQILVMEDGEEKTNLQNQVAKLEVSQNQAVLNLIAEKPEILGLISDVDEEKEEQKSRLRKKRDEIYLDIVDKLPQSLNLEPSKITSLKEFDDLLTQTILEKDNQIPAFFVECVNRRTQNLMINFNPTS